MTGLNLAGQFPLVRARDAAEEGGQSSLSSSLSSSSSSNNCSCFVCRFKDHSRGRLGWILRCSLIWGRFALALLWIAELILTVHTMAEINRSRSHSNNTESSSSFSSSFSNNNSSKLYQNRRLEWSELREWLAWSSMSRPSAILLACLTLPTLLTSLTGVHCLGSSSRISSVFSIFLTDLVRVVSMAADCVSMLISDRQLTNVRIKSDELDSPLLEQFVHWPSIRRQRRVLALLFGLLPRLMVQLYLMLVSPMIQQTQQQQQSDDDDIQPVNNHNGTAMFHPMSTSIFVSGNTHLIFGSPSLLYYSFSLTTLNLTVLLSRLIVEARQLGNSLFDHCRDCINLCLFGFPERRRLDSVVRAVRDQHRSMILLRQSSNANHHQRSGNTIIGDVPDSSPSTDNHNNNHLYHQKSDEVLSHGNQTLMTMQPMRPVFHHFDLTRYTLFRVSCQLEWYEHYYFTEESVQSLIVEISRLPSAIPSTKKKSNRRKQSLLLSSDSTKKASRMRGGPGKRLFSKSHSTSSLPNPGHLESSKMQVKKTPMMRKTKSRLRLTPEHSPLLAVESAGRFGSSSVQKSTDISRQISDESSILPRSSSSLLSSSSPSSLIVSRLPTLVLNLGDSLSQVSLQTAVELLVFCRRHNVKPLLSGEWWRSCASTSSQRGCDIRIAEHAFIGDRPILHVLLDCGVEQCTLQSMLGFGMDPNILDHKGRTTVHYCIERGMVDELRFLCSLYCLKKVDPSSVDWSSDDDGSTSSVMNSSAAVSSSYSSHRRFTHRFPTSLVSHPHQQYFDQRNHSRSSLCSPFAPLPSPIVSQAYANHHNHHRSGYSHSSSFSESKTVDDSPVAGQQMRRRRRRRRKERLRILQQAQSERQKKFVMESRMNLNLESYDSSGIRPLFKAVLLYVRYKKDPLYLEMVDILVDSGVNVNIKYRQHNLIEYVLDSGLLRVAIKLLYHGAIILCDSKMKQMIFKCLSKALSKANKLQSRTMFRMIDKFVRLVCEKTFLQRKDFAHFFSHRHHPTQKQQQQSGVDRDSKTIRNDNNDDGHLECDDEVGGSEERNVGNDDGNNNSGMRQSSAVHSSASSTPTDQSCNANSNGQYLDLTPPLMMNNHSKSEDIISNSNSNMNEIYQQR